jgi:nucleoside-diphosphate-sugar epimerase
MGKFPWQIGRFDPRSAIRAGGTREELETVPNVALIAGVTGIVGNTLADQLAEEDAPGGPWKVYGLARRPKPDWLNQSNLIYIQCNLLEREQTLAKLSPLHDVTHIFYVTWVNRDTEEESCEANGGMLRNVIDGLLPNAKELQHIVLQTGGKHYTGPFAYAGKLEIPDAPFKEDSPRLPCPNFYHTQEDIVFDTVKQKQGLTYSVHRPTVIFGFTAGNLMNMVCTLAVYASICKYEGKPLIFPGNRVCWTQLFDASDASLIAEQEIWASLDPKAKNQAFNSSNGDLFIWKRLWHLLAEKYELQVPEYKGEPTSLSELMKGKEQVWDKIVQENGLQPLELHEVGHWWFADLLLNQPMENVSSMNKSREHGFLGWCDTEKSFLSAIDKARANKVVL